MILVFDLSGVFFNKGFDVAVSRICEEFGLSKEKVENVLDGPFSEEYRTGTIEPVRFWEKAKAKLGVEDIEKVREIFFSSYFPNESSVELIKELKKKGFKVGFLSNNPPDRVEYLDEKYHFISHFDFGAFSSEIGFRKPDKLLYQKFLKKFKLKPEEVIYIDDREKNLNPAGELGMNVILFKDVEQVKKELEELDL